MVIPVMLLCSEAAISSDGNGSNGGEGIREPERSGGSQMVPNFRPLS